MPRKPKRPCSYPGCPNLTDGRFCEEHSKLYNQNLTKGSVLIEIGTDANTMEEAYYSAELVGKAIAEVL